MQMIDKNWLPRGAWVRRPSAAGRRQGVFLDPAVGPSAIGNGQDAAGTLPSLFPRQRVQLGCFGPKKLSPLLS